MTFKIVSACLLVHTQPRKGFSGPSETGERINKYIQDKRQEKNCNLVAGFYEIAIERAEIKKKKNLYTSLIMMQSEAKIISKLFAKHN